MRQIFSGSDQRHLFQPVHELQRRPVEPPPLAVLELLGEGADGAFCICLNCEIAVKWWLLKKYSAHLWSNFPSTTTDQYMEASDQDPLHLKALFKHLFFFIGNNSPVVEADLVLPRRRRLVLDGLAEGHGSVQQDLQIGIPHTVYRTV